MKYRRDIDGLRAVAVLPVVLFHAGLGLTGGFVGVDIFFVISRFLITSILVAELEGGRFSILGFYERRARRILPALFAMLAVVSLAAVGLFIPEDLDNFGKSLAAAAVFLSNVWFFSELGYFTEAADLKPLLHTWSLGIEEQYYLIFPVLLWVLFRTLRTAWVYRVLVVLTCGSFALSLWATSGSPDAAFYLPQYRMWELFLGSLLAIAAAWGWLKPLAGRPRLSTLLAVAGFLAIPVAVLSYGPETDFPGLAAALPCLGALLMLATGAVHTTPVSTLLSTAPFVFIGRISYSVYLWHWPVLSLRLYVTGRPPDLLDALACVGVSIALGYASWRFIEAPFRDRGRFSRTQILAGAFTGLSVAVVIGAVLAKTDGLPGRMDDDLYALVRVADDPSGQDCHFVTPDRARRGDVCVLGDSSAEPSFILVGDSHAGALSPAVFAAAEAIGVAGYQYTNSDFRPLLGVSKRGSPGWGEQTDVLVDFITARAELTTVFVTGYWLHQMTGYTYRHSGDIWEDDGYDGGGSDYNATATLQGLRRFAEHLPDVRIVLLDDVPSGEVLNIRSLLRAHRFGRADLSGLDAAIARDQRRVYEAAFSALAAASDNVSYVPILETLCGPSHCPLFDGETLVFRDGDHLSAAAALNLTADARRLLEQSLPERRTP